MNIEAIVIPAAIPGPGTPVSTALNTMGKPRVLVPMNNVTIQNLTVTGSTDVSGGDFIDAVIDGGVANSEYCEGFDLDGGSA